MENLTYSFKTCPANRLPKVKWPFVSLALLMFLLFFTTLFTHATNYYSNGSNAPNLTTSWRTNRDGTGSNPSNFTSGDDFFIQNGHTMTTSAAWAVSGTGNSVTVETGGTLVASFAVSATTWSFASGATYQHAQNGGAIPTATWNATSNCNITGVTGTVPSGLNPSGGFGNFTWNCSGQNTNLYLASNMIVQGDFTVQNTGGADHGSRSLRMTNNTSGYTISVGGDFNVLSPATFKMNNAGAACVLNISGNMNVAGQSTGTTGFYLNSASASGSSATVNLTGHLNVSSGYLIFSDDGGSYPAILNLKGNFNQSGGTISNTNTSGGYIGTFNFNGTTAQTFTKTAGTIASIINFTISPSSTVDFGTSELNGSTGTFTLSSGGSITTAHTGGISTTPSTGCIQVTGTKTYSAGANYIYNGTAAQVTGNGLPTSLTGNLTINNSAGTGSTGVTLSQATTISGSGKLVLTNGVLTTTTANALTIANTAADAISGGSPSTFVSGPLKRTLPANLSSSGNSYHFPVGKVGTYYPMSFSTLTTGGTAPVITAEAFNANTGGSAGTGLGSLSTTEYWSASVSTGNYTNGSVSVTRQAALGTLARIGRNTSTLNGTYVSIGGTPDGTSIINSDLTGASLGYFVMGTAACTAPTSVALSGFTTPICYNTSPGTFTATPSGGSPTSYTYLWYLNSSSTGITTNTYDPGALTSDATFYCAVSTGSGCTTNSAAQTITITPTVGTPTTPSGPATLCQGASPTAYTTSATNATSYTWSVTGAGNTISGTGTEGTVTWTAGFSGSATVSVAANGCGTSSQASWVITVNPAPAFTTQGHNISCNGASDGSIVVHFTTGVDNSPYKYSFNNGADGYVNSLTYTNPDYTISGLSATTYNIRIRDKNGCESPTCP